MHASTALLAAVLLAVLHALATPAELPFPKPVDYVCNTSMAGTYEPNATYLANLRRLSTTLPAAAAASATLFATDAAGRAHDRAFALALCRGDITDADDCFNCVSNAFDNSLRLCAARDATYYSDICYLRFSPDQSFLSSNASNAPERILQNPNNVTASSAGRFFGLVVRLVNATADRAASSARRFASGEAEFDEGQIPKVYAVAQCTPDMAAARCRGCLGGLIAEMPAWFSSGRQGGRILGVRCNVRYEVYACFSGAVMVEISNTANRARAFSSSGTTIHSLEAAPHASSPTSLPKVLHVASNSGRTAQRPRRLRLQHRHGRNLQAQLHVPGQPPPDLRHPPPRRRCLVDPLCHRRRRDSPRSGLRPGALPRGRRRRQGLLQLRLQRFLQLAAAVRGQGRHILLRHLLPPLLARPKLPLGRCPQRAGARPVEHEQCHGLIGWPLRRPRVQAPERHRRPRGELGEAEFHTGHIPKVYAVAQCTPDMVATRCRGCLGGLVGEMTASLGSGRQGGRILGVRCNVRYDAYPFFSGDGMVKISDTARRASKIKLYWIIATVVALAVLFICLSIWILWMKRRKRTGERNLQEQTMNREEVLQLWRIEESGSEFSLFEFSQLAEATNNFSAANILGEGGFGRVYKGQLPDGLEIAVKRLGACSRQGLLEFKNEIQLIARLQHTNLVTVRGCCVQGDEKMLVYEYMINKSLDSFIFDKAKRELLNWNRRFQIIEGIAQGLLYLHKHSRLRIIHRDLKASNILLDSGMNPKISDFGMAKIFSSNMTEGNTNRVVGTYGYMAPEYASEGLFSTKSDVFSFGVLLLEIISGQKNSAFYKYGKFFNFFGYAWQLWGEDRWLELIDPALGGEYRAAEIMRCTQVALLCVQENAADRPTISEVIAMLSNESMSLSEPKQPAYFNTSVSREEISCTTAGPCSVNDVTISAIDPR